MSLSQQFLESLLYEEEGEVIDFKSEQYPFEEATKDEKSELLKDILAFANSWRRASAYIIIGVEEVRGGRSSLCGVDYHLDDAKLQQFVNSKTQRPVNFSYIESKLDGFNVGIISIPPQERPTYLKEKYGKLDKDVVYIRRGSSTDIASPEEIAKMGQLSNREESAIPIPFMEFFDEANLNPLGNSIQIETVNLNIPKEQEIPDYGVYKFPIGINVYSPLDITVNRDYYREFARYLKELSEYSKVDFQVINEGNIVAKDVRIEIFIEDSPEKLFICDSNDISDEPSSKKGDLLINHLTTTNDPDIWVEHYQNGWIINAELGKIQPKASVHTISGLFIGSKTPVELTITAKVFADNLPSPKIFDLSIDIQTQNKFLPVDELIDLIENNHFGDNEENYDE